MHLFMLHETLKWQIRIKWYLFYELIMSWIVYILNLFIYFVLQMASVPNMVRITTYLNNSAFVWRGLCTNNLRDSNFHICLNVADADTVFVNSAQWPCNVVHKPFTHIVEPFSLAPFYQLSPPISSDHWTSQYHWY